MDTPIDTWHETSRLTKDSIVSCNGSRCTGTRFHHQWTTRSAQGHRRPPIHGCMPAKRAVPTTTRLTGVTVALPRAQNRLTECSQAANVAGWTWLFQPLHDRLPVCHHRSHAGTDACMHDHVHVHSYSLTSMLSIAATTTPRPVQSLTTTRVKHHLQLLQHLHAYRHGYLSSMNTALLRTAGQ